MGGYFCVCVCLGCSGRGVYISLGVGRLYVAYPFLGAMRRPDFRDRHGETFSHVFFVSMVFLAVVKNGEYD